jgi:hypothetical protein
LAGVQIHIPPFLQPYTEKTSKDWVDCSTIMECLKTLTTRFPQLKPQLFYTEEKLRRELNIFLNDSRVHPKKLAEKVKEGDKLYIAHVIAGG